MVISSKGRYALRVMVDLAEHGGDGYVSMRDVAGVRRFPTNTPARS